MIRRILFTGDVLRTAEAPLPLPDGRILPAFRETQTDNILWLYRLLGRRLAEATGLPVAYRAWGEGFDTPGFYRAEEAPQDAAGWARLFGASTLGRRGLTMVEHAYHEALVIGFEMAESIKRALSQLGIPWVDLNLHPIRFLPDVFFAVQTNTASIFAALRQHHMAEDHFYDWADILSASAVKLPHVRVPPGSWLLPGQVATDRSLIHHGRLVTLADYRAALLQALPAESPLLFKPHPYAERGFGLDALGLEPGRLIQTTANIYALLPHRHVEHVIGLSSSVLMEAHYFGRPATALAGLPFDIPAKADAAQPHQHLSLYDACFSTDVWREALSSLTPTTRPTGHDFRRPPNTLRLALRNFWGFNEVTTNFLVDLHGNSSLRR